MRRRPTKTETIRSLLSQAPLPIPSALVNSISSMASPSVLRELAARSDPLDADALEAAALMADQQEHVPDVTSTPETDRGEWPAFWEARPAEDV